MRLCSVTLLTKDHYVHLVGLGLSGFKFYEILDFEKPTSVLRCLPFKVRTGVHWTVSVLCPGVVCQINDRGSPFLGESREHEGIQK